MIFNKFKKTSEELKDEYQEKYNKIQLRNYEITLKNKLKEEKRKVKRFRFSEMKTSNLVLLSSIIMIILFTIACLFVQYKTSVEVSGTLITLWFSFWTVEIISLAGIKITKVIKEQKDNKGEDIAPSVYENESENETIELCE